jgi:hypothetical protein
MKTTGRSQRWPGIFLGLALLCLLPLPGFAQNARLQLNRLEKLNSKAAEVNDVTLEGEMLKLAAKFMEMDGDPEAAQIKDIIKDLKGIYIKNFEFDQPNQYSPEDVAEVRAQLAAPGWSRIVENRTKRGGETNEIYVMKDGNKIAGVAILVAEPKELTVVNIVGPIDLDKLSALEGKFGIPDEDNHPKPKNTPSGEKPHEEE